MHYKFGRNTKSLLSLKASALCPKVQTFCLSSLQSAEKPLESVQIDSIPQLSINILSSARQKQNSVLGFEIYLQK